MKLQQAVKKETIHITYGVCGLGVIVLLAFVLSGRFDLPVFFGLALGGLVSIANFLLLGITVQKAAKSSSDKGRYLIRLSYSVRILLLGIYIFFAMKTPWLNPVTAIAALFFPRITIAIMNFAGYFGKRRDNHES
ncbi:ATP synthase subunit I [Lachnospiraceae bacterium 54-53]